MADERDLTELINFNLYEKLKLCLFEEYSLLKFELKNVKTCIKLKIKIFLFNFKNLSEF